MNRLNNNPVLCKTVAPNTPVWRRRNKRVLRPRGTLFAEEHETDHNEPPDTPDRTCGIGSYCMRAHSTLVERSSKETLREYTGFDDNPGIVDKVQGVCDRDIHRFGDSFECTPPRLFFIGPVENCDGRVSVFDLKQNTVSVVP